VHDIAQVGGRTLFVEPDDGYDPVLSAIAGARDSIDLVVYLLTDRSVIDALIDARQRGVSVRLMLEQDPYGSGPGNGAVYAQLRDAGVDVRWANPAFALTHEKALVIDGNTALIMTLNLVYSAFHGNREYGIITRDPVEVAEVLAGFNADWERKSFKPNAPSLLWSDANTRSKLLALIDGARSSLLLEQESLQDRELLQHVAKAAQRGVAVRVVTAPISGSSDPNRRGRQQLLSAGAVVRTLAKPKMHAKVVVADDTRSVVGSANFTYSAMDINRELGIRLDEPDIVRRLVETFESDWSQAEKVQPSD
jgi:phosphatidylserine/phosphatidylglycerophosphate/cardiolipin synthase-like enzyme